MLSVFIILFSLSLFLSSSVRFVRGCFYCSLCFAVILFFMFFITISSAKSTINWIDIFAITVLWALIAKLKHSELKWNETAAYFQNNRSISVLSTIPMPENSYTYLISRRILSFCFVFYFRYNDCAEFFTQNCALSCDLLVLFCNHNSTTWPQK